MTLITILLLLLFCDRTHNDIMTFYTLLPLCKFTPSSFHGHIGAQRACLSKQTPFNRHTYLPTIRFHLFIGFCVAFCMVLSKYLSYCLWPINPCFLVPRSAVGTYGLAFVRSSIRPFVRSSVRSSVGDLENRS